MHENSDTWTALERARSSFSKGLASIQFLVQRNTEDIDRLRDAERSVNDRIIKLEAQFPGDLLQRLAIVEDRIVDLRDNTKEVTGQIRTLHIDEAKGVNDAARARVNVEDKKARYGIAVAIITAIGSVIIQLVKWLN